MPSNQPARQELHHNPGDGYYRILSVKEVEALSRRDILNAIDEMGFRIAELEDGTLVLYMLDTVPVPNAVIRKHIGHSYAVLTVRA